MHASNWKKKPPEVFKRIKIILSVMQDKFAMSIRLRKLTMSFKKLFSCINYLQVPI